MFQKCNIQNMKLYHKCEFKTWKYVSETWRWEHEIFQKSDIQNMKCSRNVTCKIWKCFRKVTFWTWNILKTSRFWNIVRILNTLLLCPVTNMFKIVCKRSNSVDTLYWHNCGWQLSNFQNDFKLSTSEFHLHLWKNIDFTFGFQLFIFCFYLSTSFLIFNLGKEEK